MPVQICYITLSLPSLLLARRFVLFLPLEIGKVTLRWYLLSPLTTVLSRDPFNQRGKQEPWLRSSAWYFGCTALGNLESNTDT